MEENQNNAAYIFNVTTQVNWDVHAGWLQWMQDVHIPEIIGTGCFIKHQFVKLVNTDETDGPVYAAQYYAQTMAEYELYINRYKPLHDVAERNRWFDKTFSFSSLMQVVH